MADQISFAIGQKVNFPVVRQTGRTIKFSNREGVIQRLDDNHAVVKVRNGHTYQVPFDEMPAIGQQNALTKAVLAGLGIAEQK